MPIIQKLPLEAIMGDRFGRYSKYIIQERALPDIRDGLKPVQRRILYSMSRDGNTFDQGWRKSAKSVGNVMGNFHPHGDSSIYEAMIRLSQDWKMMEPLIEMHGNNGSMDGDPPAAMRYTEARLSEIAGFLLADIDKETVPTSWNFDDTEKEPTVLPAAFPALLVNGSTGISAGYATDIPPHNLAEVIDATVYLIDHPEADVARLMTLLPGPDFPTGAIIQGKDEIAKAYATGKGRIVLRSRASVAALRGGREQIVVTEIPYEVNKATLVKRIDEVRANAKVPGIAEVRDESDREGLRIAVDLKKDADAQLVLNYLYKNTDLQVNYNFNMVAIDAMTPRQVGVLEILRAYIAHRRQVIVKRSAFDLGKARKRLHLVEGLIRMVSILDAVVALIRASENKADAKVNLQTSYDFSEAQAEAIVTLQLYRLTNTDIVTLEEEQADLQAEILELEAIINDEKTLYNVMKRELREVKRKFGKARRSELVDEVETIEIAAHELIAEEETVVSVTRAGYVKRTSPRSFASSGRDEVGKREDDRLVFVAEHALTTAHVLIFTSGGSVIYRPVHELVEARWKDVGEHLSQLVGNVGAEESVLFATVVSSFEAPEARIVAASRAGQIKQVALSEFSPWRTYRSKAAMYMKLKGADDAVVAVFAADGAVAAGGTDLTGAGDSEIDDSAGLAGVAADGQAVAVATGGRSDLEAADRAALLAAGTFVTADEAAVAGVTESGQAVAAVTGGRSDLAEAGKAVVAAVTDLLLISANGYGLRFLLEEVPVLGARASGVKAMNLKAGDRLVAAFPVSGETFYTLSQRGFVKRVKCDEIPVTSRANRGLQILRALKTKPHTIVAAGPVATAAESPDSLEELDLFNATAPEAAADQTLHVTTDTGATYDVALAALPLSERTSNGSPIASGDIAVVEAEIQP